jgi:hypothetical protein
MDSPQKIKFTNKILAMVKTPEQTHIVRTLFCDDPTVVSVAPKSGTAPVTEAGLSRKEIGAIMIGLLPTLAGIVIEDRFALFACLALSWLAAMYVCWIHQGRLRGRAVFAIFATLAYGGIIYRMNTRYLDKAKDDVSNRMEINMTPVNTGKPVELIFSIHNGSEYAIPSYKVQCFVHALATQSGLKLEGKGTGTFEFPVIQDEGAIGRLGGIAAGRCMLERVQFDSSVRCLDLAIKVSYASPFDSNDPQEKWIRFIVTEPTGPNWIPVSNATNGNYCEQFHRLT